MKERLLQVVSIGFMVLFMGAVSAEPEDGGHRGRHHGHAGMMHGGPDFSRIVEHNGASVWQRRLDNSLQCS